MGASQSRGEPHGKVVMYASVSVDGFIADENDQPGPLFDWLVSGDAVGRERRVEGVADVLRLRPAVLGPDRGDDRRPPRLRHDGRLGRDTSGWDRPRGRRDPPEPEGWDLEAPFHFVDGIEAAVAKAQELAGTAWSRSPLATRRPGACRGPGRRGAHGRRTRGVRIRQALLLGRSTRHLWRILTW